MQSLYKNKTSTFILHSLYKNIAFIFLAVEFVQEYSLILIVFLLY